MVSIPASASSGDAVLSPLILSRALSGFCADGEVSGAGAARFTGVAAPRLVPGAIAAIWLAYRMYVPALAARAPLGATNAATGTGEASTSLIIWRIDKSRPPGVSI